MLKVPIKIKRDLTDDQKQRILNSADFIGNAISAIEMEMMMDITDTRFKSPRLNNDIKRMKEGANSLKSYLSSFSKIENQDDYDYEFAVEFHRVLTHFSKCPTGQIRAFMDRVEQIEDSTQKI